MTRAGDYVLGTHDEELERLGLQHRLWAAQAHAAWERARLRPGQRVLDVGCGPGYASADLGVLVGPAGAVLGIDESERFVEAATRHAQALGLAHVRATVGDVRDLAAAGAAPGRFDLAWARWVLCFVEGMERVVRGAAAALTPGGRFVVHDYFNYEALTLAPRQPAFEPVRRAIVASWRQRGGDPDVVASLLAILPRHGLEIEHIEAIQRIARPGHSMWAWPDSFFRSFLPRLVEMGHLSAAHRTEFEGVWQRAGEDPACLFHLPPVYEVIARKR
jgi:SAM-dependent methyltransferase